MRGRLGATRRFTKRYAYRREGARGTKACPWTQVCSARMFFLNDPLATASVPPMSSGGVDQLARSPPAEFPFSVNLDEII